MRRRWGNSREQERAILRSQPRIEEHLENLASPRAVPRSETIQPFKMNEIKAPEWPMYTEEEIQQVSDVLRSGRVNYWTGENCRSFEREFARKVGSLYAVAVSNGTVALELALRALNIGEGDEVVVSPRSFIASASCVVAVGATPVFADVDRDSGNLSARSIASVLSSRTKACIVVHLAGWPAEMEEIMDLSREKGLFVIEDCAQAHGARYRGESVGAIGHIGAFSFCQDKIISTGGEGGMVVTDNEEVFNSVWSFKDHGKAFATVYRQDHPPGFRWLHESFGGNYRMTEVQAVIGRSQLGRLESMVERRGRFADMATKVLKQLDVVRLPKTPGHILHSYYRYYFYVEPSQLRDGWSRDRILDELNQKGCPGMSGSCSEIYLEKAFRDTPYGPKNGLPIAKELGETSIMFPVFPEFDEEYVGRLLGNTVEILGGATR